MADQLSSAERLEALMRIADFHIERLKTRQALEWRVTFGFWAVLTASLIYIKQGLPPVGIIILVAMLTLHAIWIFLVNLRNFHEVTRAYFYRDCSEKILNSSAFDFSSSPKGWNQSNQVERSKIKVEVIKSPLVWFQFAITMLLVVLIIWLPKTGLLHAG